MKMEKAREILRNNSDGENEKLNKNESERKGAREKENGSVNRKNATTIFYISSKRDRFGCGFAIEEQVFKVHSNLCSALVSCKWLAMRV